MAERKEIELIPKEIEAAKSREARLRQIRLAGFGFFLLSFLIAGGIFAFSWSLSTQLKDLQQESAKQVAQIAQFADVESKVLGLADKSLALTEILTQRDYFSIAVEAVEASRPAELKVTGLTIQKDKTLITINGETANYIVLAAFLQNLLDIQKGGTLFTDVGLSSVNLNSAKGTAEFVIEAITRKNGLKQTLSVEEVQE
uniref:PilN domain-containing protein n=1 Tax=candidate division WWE3 bacterium TaxID=2053526 RepID=A0A832E0L1_UNCKA